MSDARGAHPADPGGPADPPTPARQRRTVVAAAVVTLVLLLGTAWWYVATRDGPTRTPPAPAGLAAEKTGLTWWMGRVDRAGSLSVYVSRAPGGPPCAGAWLPRATVTVDTATVTVTVHDDSATGIGCASDDKLAELRIDLPEPLAGRTVRDGYDDGRRPVYREADLPVVPDGSDGWSEVPTTFTAPRPGDYEPPGAWALSYTRSGGPDIRIRGYPSGHALAAAPDTDPVGTVEVAGARGTIHPYGEGRFRLRWEVPGTVYLLDVLPREGQAGSLSQTRDVLARVGVG
ncbi:hypothetical protein [Plantactinospora endophytica]|uniref:DUF5642 domain-containing protein n=1 Tax=Plantactinospora endophytica TaxID=673535 RepID=A0ABQ4E401_9ACTN|nr:hypothetical protein [Plantactinospora endophytica]GIG89438.1 hypothetical protein Pen02_43740 [Plantactinospora endophytica]